ncbi:hypothetical protein BR93DRAFT_764350 [Coniochaeta sp. PMI_546]|nr:hypothetical protein BR93DRAFT_764350 [Coniochaeta sp. PMI_546]
MDPGWHHASSEHGHVPPRREFWCTLSFVLLTSLQRCRTFLPRPAASLGSSTLPFPRLQLQTRLEQTAGIGTFNPS